MIINQTNLDLLNTAYNAAFKKGFTGVAPMWDRVATLVPSTTDKEAYAWLGQFPRLREWVGDRVIQAIKEDAYTLKNKKFEATAEVPADAIRDDQYGVYSTLMESYGQAAATHPDEQIFAALQAGDASLCFDGQPFFNANHPVGMPGFEVAVSNIQAGAGPRWYLMDTTRPLKPLIYQKREGYTFVPKVDPQSSDRVFMTDNFTYGIRGRMAAGYAFWQLAFMSRADVTAANVEAAYTAMTQLTSNEGRKLGVKPNVVLCGPSTFFAMRQLIEAQIINATSNTLYKLLEIVNVPYLD